jgi:putative ABC transport system permease protein
MSPFRLAWRQLIHDPLKLLAGVAGVVFAVLLMFMQLGFRDALFDSATAVQRGTGGDLFLAHRQSQALWRPVPFTRRRVAQALAVPGVAAGGELYVGLGHWRNPWNARRRTILVLGCDPDRGILDFPGVEEHRADLRLSDTVLFDRRSHPGFGPVGATLRTNPVIEAHLGQRRLTVRGAFDLGASFAADGNLLTSELNFVRYFPDRNLSQTDFGILRLTPGTDVAQVQRELRALMPVEMLVMDRAEFIAWEMRYWQEVTPIGFIFALGTVMGFVVGVVVVYQILFTEVTNHLPQYATLKAMGYTQGFLSRLVAGAAVILAVLGFLPGLLVSAFLYHLTRQATFLPMNLLDAKLGIVFGLTLLMCLASGALALRKLKAADPAEMF